MLACVCLNPSFDRTVSLRSFTAGDVNRVLSARQDVGGKGINVAITARRLGIASCVLGCAGKNGIDAVRRKLDGEQVTHVFLPVDGVWPGVRMTRRTVWPNFTSSTLSRSMSMVGMALILTP